MRIVIDNGPVKAAIYLDVVFALMANKNLVALRPVHKCVVPIRRGLTVWLTWGPVCIAERGAVLPLECIGARSLPKANVADVLSCRCFNSNIQLVLLGQLQE
eukprot:SAG31_NODE_583_length_13888_cov_18.838277_7_plen_102_part_00